MRAHIVPLLRLPADKGAFFYDATAFPDLMIGMLVRIPWRSSPAFGMVIAVDAAPTDGYKPIANVVHTAPFLSTRHVRSAMQLAEMYHVHPGIIFKMMLPPLQPRALKSLVLSELRNDHAEQLLEEYVWAPPYQDFFAQDEGHLRIHLFPTKAHIQKIAAHLRSAFPDQQILTFSREDATKTARMIWEHVHSSSPVWILTTRNGAFLPLPADAHVYLWLAQDEHHKSWDAQPYYHTLDVLRARQSHEAFAIACISHTASLEQIACLQQQTATQRTAWQPEPLPITIVDVIEEYRKKNFELINEYIAAPLAQSSPKAQCILLHNRKGYAQLAACKECEREFPPEHTRCPRCGSTKLRLIAKGIDALATVLRQRYPHKRIALCSADEASDDLAQADIIIATDAAFTQVNFSTVAAVWIPYADRYLAKPWYSAVEDAFYYLRELRFHMRDDAQLIVHTWQREHLFWNALTDRDALRTLYAKELQDRERHQYPPATYLVRTLTPRGLPNAAVHATTYASQLHKISAKNWLAETCALARRLPRNGRIDPRPLPF